MKVSVSILSNYEDLLNTVYKVNDSSADFLHIDVMDGKFVDDVKFPIQMVEKIKEISTKPLDVHLMVKDEETVKKYANLKPDMLTFHVEILKDNSLIKYVKELGIKVGLAINPLTSIKELLPYLNDLDLILFMSVTPGKGGQKFKPEVLDKIAQLRNLAKKEIIISIDGGVNDTTIESCKKAGCKMVVSGSFITNSFNYEDNIKKLR